MKAFDTNLPNPRFKHDDKVWITCDPRQLKDKSMPPVFEGEIESCTIKITKNYDEEPVSTISYEIYVGALLDEVRRDEPSVYLTKNEAFSASLKEVEGFVNQSKKQLDDYNRALEVMRK